MHEYDTGLLVETRPGSRIFLSLNMVVSQKSLETLLERLPDADASSSQLRMAAQRAWKVLSAIDISGLHMQGDDGNEEGRHILGMCAHVLSSMEFWATKAEALKNLRRFLVMSQHACLLLGVRLPRDYVKQLHFNAVLVGFTDDSEDEATALERFVTLLKAAPPVTSKAMEASVPFIIAQRREMLQELNNLVNEARELIQDSLDSASNHFAVTVPAHAKAGMILLTRISQDLEGVRVLTEAARPVQALTLDAVIFELSYMIGYFGKHENRAERWLNLKDDERLSHDDGTFPSIKDFVGYSVLNHQPELSGGDLRQTVAVRYQEYKFLCGFKHGHAGNTQRSALRPVRGEGMVFSPDPRRDNLETWLALVGIWKGIYLALNVALNSFFQFSYETPELSRRLVHLIDRLLKLDKENTELDDIFPVDVT